VNAFSLLNKKYNRLIAAVLGAFLSFTISAESTASSVNNFNTQQKEDIEQIIHDYLIENPAVLIEATKALQAQQQKEMVDRAHSVIQEHAQAIFSDPNSPIIGNPKGSVTLVEFFDYQCGVCKRMGPIIKNLIQKHPELRVVLKQWPIFGATSEYAAKAALASVRQNKFLPFYEALLDSKSRLTEDSILAIARSKRLYVNKLRRDLQNPAFTEELDNNLKLAEALRLIGTPAFIIASTPNGVYINDTDKTAFVPGAASEEALSQLIQKAQA